jgi:hypothetical protein
MTVRQSSRGSRKPFEDGLLKRTMNCGRFTSWSQHERNRKSLDARSGQNLPNINGRKGLGREKGGEVLPAVLYSSPPAAANGRISP